jgi:hypothetical protein
MPLFEVTFRTSPIDDATEDVLLDEMNALVATHGAVTLITVTAEAACGIDAAMVLVKALRAHGVTVHRVEKDLVNAATIASRCSESRTAVMHYIQGSRRVSVPFPAPEVSGSPSLWRWPDVNDWLRQVGKTHDGDIAYLTRDEESQVDHRLCVARRAETASFTAVVMASVSTVRTPADQRVEVAAMKYVS